MDAARTDATLSLTLDTIALHLDRLAGAVVDLDAHERAALLPRLRRVTAGLERQASRARSPPQKVVLTNATNMI